MPKVKRPIINYTGKDFNTIKKQLVDYAQKYYPETFKDFNEASFGSLMLDMVSYVGDMLSFYTDYQANESFLETALEYDNILKLANQVGYKHMPNASSFGEASFFIRVPASAGGGGPNYSLAPVLKQGSTFSSVNGELFTLVEDIDFKNTSEKILVANSNAEGSAPTHYALKARGAVVSGQLFSQEFTVGDYKKFLKLTLFDTNLTEIIKVFDADGNNYYEVDYLTQDVVYVPVLNVKDDRKFSKNILKPIAVPRRFVKTQNASSTTLQFGFGAQDNEAKVLDPVNVVLDVHGKNHISDKSFDPTVLSKTDKLGVVPTNTILTVIYRRNTSATVNVSVGQLTTVVSPQFTFPNAANLNLSPAQTSEVINSLELTNETSITGDVTDMSSEELKLRIQGTHAAQNRAVTRDDYINMVYNMPSNFGQVRKAMITRDQTSFNGKNLNLFVVSSNPAGVLVQTNDIIKQNLKTWINKYKMFGDTIDILDAKIINLQIRYTVQSYANVNTYNVVSQCNQALMDYFREYYFDIGEPFRIGDVYQILNSLSNVVDTKKVEVSPKLGSLYTDFGQSYESLASADGRYLVPPEDAVFEIKYPDSDITGEVI